MGNFSRKTVYIAIAAILIITGSVLYFTAPAFLYNNAMSGLRKDSKVTIKSVDIPDFKIVYAEGGTGDTVIMLHGFGGNKDNWMYIAKYFTPEYHVIIPDLPGFGDTSKPQNLKYNIMSQVERLNLFVKALKLEKFHIVGNSMGGSIAGNYAASYPEMVKSLALFDSAGVATPVKSERTLLLEKGTNFLVVKDVKGYDKLLEMNFVKPFPIPSLIKKYLAEQAIKAGTFNDKIYSDISNNDLSNLESRLDKITAPTLILWGDSDRVIHVSAVPVFEKKIKNSKSAIIKECGHLPMMEKPVETSKIYLDFLKGNK